MPYSAEISRTNPSVFLFLLDQSGSMNDPFGGDMTKRKADKVADVINRFLQNLTIKCAKNEGIRDYYYVGVIGYCGDRERGGLQIGSAFTGALAGRELVPISEVGNTPARIEERSKKVDDGAGGLVEQKVKFPVWFDPEASGGTPMCQALEMAHRIIADWTSQHDACFPPIVINISDGESTDGDPSAAASAIKALSTKDGSVLLFNAHLSSNADVSPVLFASREDPLPDDFARLLLDMSSNLTDFMISEAKKEGLKVSSSSKGYTFNADLNTLINFIDIGTRPSNLR